MLSESSWPIASSSNGMSCGSVVTSRILRYTFYSLFLRGFVYPLKYVAYFGRFLTVPSGKSFGFLMRLAFSRPGSHGAIWSFLVVWSCICCRNFLRRSVKTFQGSVVGGTVMFARYPHSLLVSMIGGVATGAGELGVGGVFGTVELSSIFSGVPFSPGVVTVTRRVAFFLGFTKV
jgi:hypothetical protein